MAIVGYFEILFAVQMKINIYPQLCKLHMPVFMMKQRAPNALHWEKSRYMGNTLAVRCLLATGMDVNSYHELFGYPLYLAAYYGHDEIVQLLIEHRADVHVSGNLGSILEAAADQGHHDIVRHLLGTDLGKSPRNVNKSFMSACKGGHLSIVKALLTHPFVDINFCFQYRQTCKFPLSVAIENGQRETANFLLTQNGISLSIPFQNPYEHSLYKVAEFGWADTLQLILRLDCVDPNAKSRDTGASPLLMAIKQGHEHIVRILIDRDDVQPFPFHEQEPLFGAGKLCPIRRAILGDHGGILNMLLDRYNISPNTALKPHWSILRTACAANRESTVKSLLQRKDIDPNYRMNHDTDATPLYTACDRHHASIITALLEHKGTDINIPFDKNAPLWRTMLHQCDDYTPLLRSFLRHPGLRLDIKFPTSDFVYHYHYDFGVVNMIMQRPGADLLLTDGSTPDRWYDVVARGDTEELRKLIESGKLDPNCSMQENGEPGAPLRRAVLSAARETVEFLLSLRQIDVNAGWSGSALSIAANEDDIEMIDLLLGDPRVDINHQSKTMEGYRVEYPEAIGEWIGFVGYKFQKGHTGNETPLLIAAKRGHLSAVQRLLNDERVKPAVPDLQGRTPLWWACHYRHAAVVQALLSNAESGVNVQDVRGWAPLAVAVNTGRFDTVTLLLKSNAKVSPEIPPGSYARPLHLAVQGGHEAIVQELLLDPSIDMRQKMYMDADSMRPWNPTPWEAAWSTGFDSITMMIDDYGDQDTTEQQ
ncbi:unnamed protein product [Clonostachys rosea]|uniref:Uncharacterized protein n=1 Tax=Bionectria ochroleuca TaxID=29856 RepID=A0ABY6UE03_BIOOC|nr:unnamed protein product [Clonostachys rosea]